jgi:hypothetical protein
MVTGRGIRHGSIADRVRFVVAPGRGRVAVARCRGGTHGAGPPPASRAPLARRLPRAAGRSLTQLGRLATRSVTMSAATGTFTPGSGRFAFALQQP